MSNPWKKVEAPVMVQSLSDIMLEQTKKVRRPNEDICKKLFDQCASASDYIQTNYSSKKALGTTLKAEENNDMNIEEKLSTNSSDIVCLELEHDPEEEQSEDENIVSDLDEIIEDYVCLPKGYLTRGEEANKKENVNWQKIDKLQKIISRNLELRHGMELVRGDEWNFRKVTDRQYQLDVLTRVILLKLLTDGVVENIDNLITIGSKCLIIYSSGNTLCTKHVVPKECVIKVFMSSIKNHYTTNLYNNDHCSLPQKVVARKLAENESQNIVRMQKIGLNCPEIVCLRKNVLVMSFVGKNQKAAPTLEEVKLDSKGWQRVYDEIVKAMYKLYNSACMVLGDFNPNNVLWWNSKCWFVDVSQAVTLKHLYCNKYLLNDCDRIFNFFESKATTVMTVLQLFKHITGLDEGCDDYIE